MTTDKYRLTLSMHESLSHQKILSDNARQLGQSLQHRTTLHILRITRHLGLHLTSFFCTDLNTARHSVNKNSMCISGDMFVAHPFIVQFFYTVVNTQAAYFKLCLLFTCPCNDFVVLLRVRNCMCIIIIISQFRGSIVGEPKHAALYLLQIVCTCGLQSSNRHVFS